jgi:hypothetical protein
MMRGGADLVHQPQLSLTQPYVTAMILLGLPC